MKNISTKNKGLRETAKFVAKELIAENKQKAKVLKRRAMIEEENFDSKAELKAIRKSQRTHEQNDINRFSKLTSIMPTREDIIKVVGDTVDIKINGKLIKIQSHLENQDAVLKELNEKIQPFDNTTKWFTWTGTAAVKIGAVALAIIGIIKLIQMLKL